MLDILSRGMDYIAREWRVIRQAPFLFGVALLTLGALLGLGAFTVSSWHYSGAVSFWQGAVSVRDGTIQQLQQQLSGVSPQIAAIQAGRDKIRSQLQSFYVEGASLLNEPVLKVEDLPPYVTRVESWASRIDLWIKENMGEAAEARAFDEEAQPSLVWTGLSPQQSNVKNFVTRVRRNLSTLIETAAWDGSRPAR